jgi:hypothetical protein
MPRSTRIKKNKRQEVTQQDTFRYAVGVESKARPVDYDTRVRAKDTGEANIELFKDTMQNLKQGLRDFSQVSSAWKEKQKEET